MTANECSVSFRGDGNVLELSDDDVCMTSNVLTTTDLNFLKTMAFIMLKKTLRIWRPRFKYQYY